ncbi:MAG: MBL fold metallo-hydrolase, partial [Chloroflexi bacterium]|nr:MBL fold metallo-hydrolase [Chloroflexota bacterium]
AMRIIEQITEGVFQVRIPVPFPLKYVQCYLIREEASWTLIDTGLNDAAAFAAWDAAFKELQITPKEIRRIFITHAHPDHYGLAGYFQNLSGAPVYALDEEIRTIAIEWKPNGSHLYLLGDQMIENGVPRDFAKKIVERSFEVLQMLTPQPNELTPLREGEVVQIGGSAYKIHWTPGHADGHLVLHSAENGLLFSGDMILMKITPNIPLWPGLDPNPLKNFLASLGTIERLGAKTAIPGHRALIEDIPGRIVELREHHRNRAQKCWDGAQVGRTAYEICMSVFPTIESVDDVRLAMVETLAHCEYLVGEGRLEKLEGKIIRYRQIIQHPVVRIA